MPLKLAVVGAPFSGKSSVAQALSEQYKLKVIDPEVLVFEAIATADAWAIAQASASPPADGAPAPLPGVAEGAEGGAEGEAEAEVEPPPPPPKKVVLGMELRAALSVGQALPDAALVRDVSNYVWALQGNQCSMQKDGHTAGNRGKDGDMHSIHAFQPRSLHASCLTIAHVTQKLKLTLTDLKFLTLHLGPSALSPPAGASGGPSHGGGPSLHPPSPF